MFGHHIIELGKRFEGRMDSVALLGALDYVRYNEEGLALHFLCEHIYESDIAISQTEYEQIIELVSKMDFNPLDEPFVHLAALVG